MSPTHLTRLQVSAYQEDGGAAMEELLNFILLACGAPCTDGPYQPPEVGKILVLQVGVCAPPPPTPPRPTRLTLLLATMKVFWIPRDIPVVYISLLDVLCLLFGEFFLLRIGCSLVYGVFSLWVQWVGRVVLARVPQLYSFIRPCDSFLVLPKARFDPLVYWFLRQFIHPTVSPVPSHCRPAA